MTRLSFRWDKICSDLPRSSLMLARVALSLMVIILIEGYQEDRVMSIDMLNDATNKLYFNALFNARRSRGWCQRRDRWYLRLRPLRGFGRGWRVQHLAS